MTLTARAEGEPLGRAREKLGKGELKRDARRVPWAQAAPGTVAWDAAASHAVIAALRDPEPERFDVELDIAVDLKDGRTLRFERLRPPFRNDPLPPAPR